MSASNSSSGSAARSPSGPVSRATALSHISGFCASARAAFHRFRHHRPQQFRGGLPFQFLAVGFQPVEQEIQQAKKQSLGNPVTNFAALVRGAAQAEAILRGDILGSDTLQIQQFKALRLELFQPFADFKQILGFQRTSFPLQHKHGLDLVVARPLQVALGAELVPQRVEHVHRGDSA